jgi:hypothetical protein
VASSALAEKQRCSSSSCFWKPNARHQLLLHHYQALHVRLEVSGSHDMNGELDESAYRFHRGCLVPALACTCAACSPSVCAVLGADCGLARAKSFTFALTTTARDRAQTCRARPCGGGKSRLQPRFGRVKRLAQHILAEFLTLDYW